MRRVQRINKVPVSCAAARDEDLVYALTNCSSLAGLQTCRELFRPVPRRLNTIRRPKVVHSTGVAGRPRTLESSPAVTTAVTTTTTTTNNNNNNDNKQLLPLLSNSAEP